MTASRPTPRRSGRPCPSSGSPSCELSRPTVTPPTPTDDHADRAATRSSATPRPRRSSADDGSIDWLCVPRFDSGACFAALLGDDSHGHWRIGPASGERATRRRYRDGTLVLETEWDTPEGTVRIVDCMPVRDQQRRRRARWSRACAAR